jgi:hypothetical protein
MSELRARSLASMMNTYSTAETGARWALDAAPMWPAGPCSGCRLRAAGNAGRHRRPAPPGVRQKPGSGPVCSLTLDGPIGPRFQIHACGPLNRGLWIIMIPPRRLHCRPKRRAWSRSSESLATSQGAFPAGVILALGWGKRTRTAADGRGDWHDATLAVNLNSDGTGHPLKDTG